MFWDIAQEGLVPPSGGDPLFLAKVYTLNPNPKPISPPPHP